ncbi:MAG: hypothetical protein RML45_03770 [Acetobacteraceae bacterium]|nr:hypothetical protein [Acetobacteraceae bacterium]
MRAVADVARFGADRRVDHDLPREADVALLVGEVLERDRAVGPREQPQSLLVEPASKLLGEFVELGLHQGQGLVAQLHRRARATA